MMIALPLAGDGLYPGLPTERCPCRSGPSEWEMSVGQTAYEVRHGRHRAEHVNDEQKASFSCGDWIRFDGPRDRQIDRKSTRLNSSHRCISYAVFCLKKKKE